MAFLWLLSGALTLAFLPFDHPNAAIGAAGWPLAIAIGSLSVVGAIRLLHGPVPSFSTLLALSYAGLIQVALLVWLGGGAGSAYQLLYLFWVGSAMGIHPPRRALVFLGATAVAAARRSSTTRPRAPPSTM